MHGDEKHWVDVNKKTPYFIKKDFPFEYFLKDDAYSKQSELRIMIASRNKEFYKQLERNNYNISIGDITSFAVIQDNYNKDLFLSIQGNKLIYELASPITMTMDDRSFAQLISELYQIKQNQLPGDAKRQEELDGLAKPIINHIKRKYGVCDAAGLPHRTVHSLRHTNITMQIAAGVLLVTVSGRAGHARTCTTTDFYSHFLKSSDKTAADKIEQVFEENSKSLEAN